MFGYYLVIVSCILVICQTILCWKLGVEDELRVSKTSIDTSIDNVKRNVMSFVKGTM